MKPPIALAGTLAALGLALCVVTACPVPALADTSAELQAQLDQAKAARDDYYAQAEAVSEQLNETRTRISETEGRIEETQATIERVEGEIAVKEAELAERQENLAQSIADNYKAGANSLLSLVLDATSFDDFVTRVYYADKISDSQAAAIEETNRLKAELDAKKQELDTEKAALEDQRREQEALAAQQEAQRSELDAKVQEADDYVESLGREVQEALAREAEEARRAAEAEAAAAAAAAAANAGNYYTVASTGSGSGSLTSGQRNAILGAAYSLVGKVPYVWGGSSVSSGLDCSGFTQWCYAQAGVWLPHSSSAQRSIVAAASGLKPAADALPGDLVCWEGHVGIYGGGGTVIDCTPGIGTRVASIWSPLYGVGSPV